MIIHQIRVGRMDVFAYVVGCETTKKALLIDPAAELERILDAVKRDGLSVELIVNTHAHADHTAGNASATERTGAPLVVHRDAAPGLEAKVNPMMATIIGGTASPPADRLVDDGDMIEIGEIGLEVIHTPGHSHGGMCLYGHGAVFTGDVLFVGAVGRTDLAGGSAATLRASLRARLFALPEETTVYPGHDYGSRPTSTIGHEKRTNPFA